MSAASNESYSLLPTFYAIYLLHLRLLLKAVTSKVTIVEKEKFDVEKKVVTVTDKFRTVEKILSCDNLEDFLIQGGYFNLISHIAFLVLVPLLSGVADRVGNEPSRLQLQLGRRPTT